MFILKWRQHFNPTKLLIFSRMTSMYFPRIYRARTRKEQRYPTVSSKLRIYFISVRKGKMSHAFNFNHGSRAELMIQLLLSLSFKIWVSMKELHSLWNLRNLSFFSGIIRTYTLLILFWYWLRQFKLQHSNLTLKTQALLSEERLMAK